MASAPALTDPVHRAARERHDVQLAVRAGLDVGHGADVAAEQARLALRDLPLADVVGDAVLEPRVVHVDAAAVARQLKAEQVTALEEVTRAAHEEVVLVLPAEP